MITAMSRSAPALVLILLIGALSWTPLPAQGRRLTLDDLYNPDSEVDFDGPPLRERHWMKDGMHYLEKTGNGHYLEVEARSGEARPLFHNSQFEKAFAALPGFTDADASALLSQGKFSFSPDEKRFLIRWREDLYSFDLAGPDAHRLTSDGDEEQVPMLAPSGRLVSFVRDADLWVVSADGAFTRRLTRDGSPLRLNGILDWVYQEEVYGRGDFVGHWWSSDSRRIAFLQLDESDVPRSVIVNNQRDEQKVESQLYPKAGDPNPVVRLGVATVAGGEIRWADLTGYPPDGILIVNVTWAPSSDRLLVQVQNREQTWLDLVEVRADDGSSRRLFRETTPAWVSPLGPPHWLADGSFIWESERDGYRHLYHYDSKGNLLGRLTSGEWDVSAVKGVDDERGLVFFSSGKDRIVDLKLYRVRIDGSGLESLTPDPGTHSVSLDPRYSLFLDTWSDVSSPPRVSVHDVDGAVIRQVQTPPASPLADYELGPVEFFEVPARDGFQMEAMWIKPPDFDPSRRYPVLIYVYGGPQSPTVRNRWGSKTYLWHQMLAEKGYLIFLCDNRSASGKGVRPAWSIYRDLGKVELRDLEDAVGWLKQQAFVDPDRIGLWGWSYGGFMTSYALTHSSLFRIGIAGAPVTDWHLYDSIYTERYMGLPEDNPEGYLNSSVVRAASRLDGRLLLLHGTTDDNVHPQNSIQLIDRLQQADKAFDMMLYPGSRHGVRDSRQLLHLRTLMTNFVQKNL